MGVAGLFYRLNLRDSGMDSSPPWRVKRVSVSKDGPVLRVYTPQMRQLCYCLASVMRSLDRLMDEVQCTGGLGPPGLS